MSQSQSAFKTALVLSGGGARGLSQLGVLEEIQNNKIQLDLIVGTGIGALIGALYLHCGSVAAAAGKLTGFLEKGLLAGALAKMTKSLPVEQTEEVRESPLWFARQGTCCTPATDLTSYITEEEYLDLLSHLLPDRPIADLPLAFGAATMDISNCEEILVKTGSLLKAVAASTAIPGILPAIRFSSRFLSDGSWVDSVPAVPAITMGAHFVMAVDTSLPLPKPQPPLTLTHYCLRRGIETSHNERQRRLMAAADVVIAPLTGQPHRTDFGNLKRLMSNGRYAVVRNLMFILSSKLTRRCVTLDGQIHPARSRDWERPIIFY